jgi:hypothetical protein
MKQSLLAIIPLSMVATISNVYASGPRLDYPEDATEEGAYCWIDGYDAGFAGKYDKDRADECAILADDEYNSAWKYGCKDAGYLPNECQYFKNNPDDLEHAAPACTEFLHNATNKNTPSPYGACAPGQQPDTYHPGCPQVLDPERYCLNTDDPAFCKGIGDICDEDGSVKPEYAYCKAN